VDEAAKLDDGGGGDAAAGATPGEAGGEDVSMAQELWMLSVVDPLRNVSPSAALVCLAGT